MVTQGAYTKRGEAPYVFPGVIHGGRKKEIGRQAVVICARFQRRSVIFIASRTQILLNILPHRSKSVCPSFIELLKLLARLFAFRFYPLLKLFALSLDEVG